MEKREERRIERNGDCMESGGMENFFLRKKRRCTN